MPKISFIAVLITFLQASVLLATSSHENMDAKEFANFLTSLKLPGTCELRDVKINSKGDLVMKVYEKTSHEINQRTEVLTVSNNVTTKTTNEGKTETKFIDLGVAGIRDRTILTVIQESDGSVSDFRFEGWARSRPLYRIPVLGIGLIYFKSDFIADCKNDELNRMPANVSEVERSSIKSDSSSESRSSKNVTPTTPQ